MNRTIDDDTWEALNALADGELAGDARTDLERRLAHEPALAAALSEIRTLKRTLAATAPWDRGHDTPHAPSLPPASIPGERPRPWHPRFVLPLAALTLGTLALGLVLVPRDEAPDAADALTPTSLAAVSTTLPAALHAALREPVAADVVPPPPAEPDGTRLLAGQRFPDLAAHDVRPAHALTRDTPAGTVAATLYLGPNGCDFTLSAAPDSLAAVLPDTGIPPVARDDGPDSGADSGADGGPSPVLPDRTGPFTTGFEHAVLVRAWSAGDTVWVASSEAIDPLRFAALADLAAERTSVTSTTDAVVSIARADGPTGRTSCVAG